MKIFALFGTIGMSLVLFSCSEDVTPVESVSHPPGWNDINSDNFHGLKVLERGPEVCNSCHGNSYTGGESGVACAECHTSYPHPENWSVPKDPDSHGTYIKDINWSLTSCKSCHGDDYQGGRSNASCFKCHTQNGGPEACNTCHGDNRLPVSELPSWAPPEDLAGNIGTSMIGVGAHQQHLKDTTLTTAFIRDCNMCHPTPSGFDDPNHIDDQAGINMEFNLVASDSGNVNPLWTNGSASCANVYCHGNFSFNKAESSNQWAYAQPDSAISGNNPIMIWNQVGSGQAECGTCHDLPPDGHIQATTCDGCHGTVVDANNNIIDKSKHINNQKDLSF